VCGEKTKYIHDYRCRTIKDLPAFDKDVILFYRQRRYCCHNCGKRFAEHNSFVPKYYHITRRLINKILDKAEEVCSFTSISKELNVSVSTVIRIFDRATVNKTTRKSELEGMIEKFANWTILYDLA
jgi:transposase